MPLMFRPRNVLRTSREDADRKAVPWALYGAAGFLVLVVLLLWHLLGSKPKPVAPAVASVPARAVQPAPAALSASRPAAVAAPVVSPGWYVIAYTYNHPAQAQTKVASLRRRHAALNPQVFSPSGHRPYYIALGGAMSREQAEALAHRARRSGLPRDTFARNF
jgi:hypothetical protein